MADVTARTCLKCGLLKPLTEFHTANRERFGVKSRCKDCINAAARAYYEANAEMLKAKQRSKDALAWRSKSPEERRRRTLFRKYGLTPAAVEAMLSEQGGCAICGSREPNGKNWEIDHDHGCCSTESKCCGRCIRGVLCGPCNRGLGQFRDNPDTLRAAIAYLERTGRK